MKLKIEKIELFHLLSYVNAEFSNLNNYNVLIGKNNSGKSNLLKIFRMLKENYQNGVFSSRYIYEDNTRVEASVILSFKLSKSIRRELLIKLYHGNYLEHVLISLGRLEGIHKKYKWGEKKDEIQYLIDQGYYSKVKIEISYKNVIKNICITQVSTKHKEIEEEQILLKTILKDKPDNINQTIISDISRLSVKENTIKDFFTDFPHSNIGSVSSSLRNFFSNLQVFSKHPIISILMDLIKNEFFDVIFLIPGKRKFKKDSDRDNILSTILEPNGQNLAKFIHMKKVANQDEWLLELTQELHEYFPDIITMQQMVDIEGKTFLNFKEKDIDFELRIENLGEGILNIVHFLAYIKELKENKILFIEEPELHLHPGLENKLRDKLIEISNKNLIFITTHSREFLPDNKDGCSVYLLKKENIQSTVDKIPEDKYEEIYRTLDMDISKYKLQKSLIYNEDFWIKFIRKSMEDNRIETELWDFKRTIDFWKITEIQKLSESKIKFCQQIASFANNQGGVLIIGISDKIPRNIIGLDYDPLETRVRDLKILIKKRTNNNNFVDIQQIKLKDKNNSEKICLIIVIAQTMKIVSVLRDDRSYIYKKRIGTSSESVAPEEIRESKKTLDGDNFDYLSYLKSYVDNKL
ncbi:MAG: AAA family ATPase [Promethearchaeota archaeon]|jgi:predicted ATP-dependent endonuclease of OLD family